MNQESNSCDMLEALKAYFRDTPREQVLAEWEASKRNAPNSGPTVESFLSFNKENADILKQASLGSESRSPIPVFSASRRGLNLVELEEKFITLLLSFTDEEITQWLTEDDELTNYLAT